VLFEEQKTIRQNG